MLFIAEKPKEFTPYQTLSVDFLQANETIEAKEIRIEPTDDGYVVLCAPTRLLTVFDRHKDYFKPEGLYALAIHGKAWEKNKKDGDNWVKVKVEPSPYELYFCRTMESYPDKFLGKTFTGKLQIQGNADVLQQLEAKGEALHDMTWAFTEVEVSTLLKEIDASAALAAKAGRGGYAKAQTELEKLNERKQFIGSLLGMETESIKGASILELQIAYTTIKEASKDKEAIDSLFNMLMF